MFLSSFFNGWSYDRKYQALHLRIGTNKLRTDRRKRRRALRYGSKKSSWLVFKPCALIRLWNDKLWRIRGRSNIRRRRRVCRTSPPWRSSRRRRLDARPVRRRNRRNKPPNLGQGNYGRQGARNNIALRDESVKGRKLYPEKKDKTYSWL